MPDQLHKHDVFPGGPPANSASANLSSQKFRYFLSQLPDDVRASFNDIQLAYISKSMAMPKTRHTVEYRASIPFVGRRYYLTIFFGPERRNLNRLAAEGQTDIDVVTYAHLAAFLFVVGGLSVCLVIVLYLVKSGLGIDLFDGSSLLHDLFFAES